MNADLFFFYDDGKSPSASRKKAASPNKVKKEIYFKIDKTPVRTSISVGENSEAKTETKHEPPKHLTSPTDAPPEAVAPLDIPIVDEAKIQQTRALLGELSGEFSDRDVQRFLTARHSDAKKASESMRKRVEWYNTPVSKFKIDNPRLRPRDMGVTATDSKEVQFGECFPCANIGQDKEGHPIYWEKSGFGECLLSSLCCVSGANGYWFLFLFLLFVSVVSAGWGKVKKHFTHDELTCRHIRVMEILRERCRRLSLREGKVIEQQVFVMDFKGGPLFVDWGSLKQLQEVMTIDEQYYPDTVKHLFIINAPPYFNTLFSIIRPWMNPLDIAKIQILGEDFLPVLSRFISEEVIPVEYGGRNENFSWRSPGNMQLEEDVSPVASTSVSSSQTAGSSSAGGKPTERGTAESKGAAAHTQPPPMAGELVALDIPIVDVAKIQQTRALLGELSGEFSDRDVQRFLTARHSDAKKASESMRKRVEWYNTPVSKFKIDNPRLRPRDMGVTATDSKEVQFGECFPCANIGQDKEGHPIYWEKSGFGECLLSSLCCVSGANGYWFLFLFLLFVSVVSAGWGKVKKHFTHDELTCRHIRVMEILRERCRRLSLREGKVIEQQVFVMDFKGGPLFVDWGSLKQLQEVMTIDEQYYPDTVKHLFIINAPPYFNTLFSIIRPWMNPLDIAKIQILGEDFLPVLSRFISEEVIPVEYGGRNENFSWRSPGNMQLEEDVSPVASALMFVFSAESSADRPAGRDSSVVAPLPTPPPAAAVAVPVPQDSELSEYAEGFW